MEQTVRKANSYWRRLGAPRSDRRAKSDELRDHLNAPVQNGRRVEDVVGNDLESFAAAWAQGDVKRPWVEPLLLMATALTAGPGFSSLVGLAVPGERRLGIPAGMAISVLVAFSVLVVVQLVRWFRHRLTPEQTAIIYLLTAAALIAGALFLTGVVDDDRFFRLQPAAVWLFIAASVGFQTLTAWLKRTRKL